jgi:hypothetical protein
LSSNDEIIVASMRICDSVEDGYKYFQLIQTVAILIGNWCVFAMNNCAQPGFTFAPGNATEMFGHASEGTGEICFRGETRGM